MFKMGEEILAPPWFSSLFRLDDRNVAGAGTAAGLHDQIVRRKEAR